MLINRLGGGAENLNTELSAQDTLITNITESLVGRLAGADATANDILEGKKAYVGQNLVTGTYDPSTSDENLVPPNIKDGVTIFGVTGTLSGNIPDGRVWVQTNISNINFEKIYYAEDIFVAVGTAGICYSTDGIHWFQSNISDVWIGDVCHYGHTWVAVGMGIYWSTDCIDWFQSNISDAEFDAVAVDGGTWVASSWDNGLYHSIDNGVSWTSCGVNDVCYTIYYANGVWSSLAESYPIYYSTDGINWAPDNTISFGYAEGLVRYINNKWIGSTFGIYYSTNGTTWIQSNITSGQFIDVAYGNGKWVCVGSIGIYYSTDGTTWTSSNITSGQFKDVCYTPNMWIAVGANGVYYSPDGIYWFQSNITSGQFKSICNAGNMIVAGGDGIYYSE